MAYNYQAHALVRGLDALLKDIQDMSNELQKMRGLASRLIQQEQIEQERKAREFYARKASAKK